MDDTAKISKKLERILQSDDENPDQIIKYMRRMNDIEMTLNILTKTGIGLIINKFRKKSSDTSVIAMATQLIKQWKKLVPNAKAEKRSRQSASEDPSPSRDSENGSSDDDKPSYSDKRIRHDASDSSNDTKNFQLIKQAPHKQMLSANQNTSDPSRLKARDMIFRALSSGEIASGSFSADYLAVSIETAIFNVFMNNGSEYKQRVRTRVMNLKDKNNEELRENILAGSISAEKLAIMSSEEMASKDMKKLRTKFLEEVIHESQLLEGTTMCADGVMQCRKCKKYKVDYRQAQTRSADEPMTTFAYCQSCGFRWKFC